MPRRRNHRRDTTDADPTDRVAADADMVAFLRRLARGRSVGKAPPVADAHAPPRDVVAQAVRLGFVAASAESLQLSASGRDWLRRKLATTGVGRPASRMAPSADVGSSDGNDGLATCNLAESPLGWLARRQDGSGRPILSPEQFQAGERLRTDFTFAQLTPRVTADWSGLASSAHGRRGVPGGGAVLRDEVIAARERVNRALKAIGPELAGIALDVCCYLKRLELVEAERSWPRRSGKVILKLAPDALDRHYRIGRTGRDAANRSTISHWGAADYRPALDPGEPT